MTSIIESNKKYTIDELDKLIDNTTDLLDKKMLRSINLTKESFIEYSRRCFKEYPEEYKKNKLSSKVGKMIKLLKIKHKLDNLWEENIIKYYNLNFNENLFKLESIKYNMSEDKYYLGGITYETQDILEKLNTKFNQSVYIKNVFHSQKTIFSFL